jgi:serine protease
VAAAGNDNSSQPGSPAAFSSVVSVGASDLLGQRAPYSNFNNTIDIWAPGGDMTTDRNGDGYADGVLSCMATDPPPGQAQGQFLFAFEQGTSMASPHVAGVAALMKAANPALTVQQLRDRLTASANTRPGVSLPNNGRIVDALAAVVAAGGAPPTTPLLTPTPAFMNFGATGTTATLTIDNRGVGNVTYSTAILQPSAPAFVSAASGPTETIAGNGVTGDTFQLQVDRTGLSNGVYSAVLTLRYTEDGTSNIREVDVNISMQVGASTPVADTIFVLLIDPTTLASRFQTETVAGSNFNFNFATIPAGDYLLVAGTDRDNDGLLGDEGELFGAWPDLDDPKVVTVRGGSNLGQLDFSMQDLEQLQSASLPGTARTFRRLR